jgi:hypothetical protein
VRRTDGREVVGFRRRNMSLFLSLLIISVRG